MSLVASEIFVIISFVQQQSSSHDNVRDVSVAKSLRNNSSVWYFGGWWIRRIEELKNRTGCTGFGEGPDLFKVRGPGWAFLWVLCVVMRVCKRVRLVRRAVMPVCNLGR